LNDDLKNECELEQAALNLALVEFDKKLEKQEATCERLITSEVKRVKDSSRGDDGGETKRRFGCHKRDYKAGM
jgi:hypothetical protein